MMPAIRQPPRHATPDTGEIQRINGHAGSVPPMPSHPLPPRPEPRQLTRDDYRAEMEKRVAERQATRRPWYKRLLGL